MASDVKDRGMFGECLFAILVFARVVNFQWHREILQDLAPVVEDFLLFQATPFLLQVHVQTSLGAFCRLA